MMTPLDEPVIDVAALMASLREEVRRKHGGAGRQVGEEPEGEGWTPIHASLDMAEQRAMIGSTVPNLSRFHRLLRLPARLVARVMLYLLQLITVHQREYNQSMVKAVRGLVRRFRKAQEGQNALADQVEVLEQRCGERDAQLALLESRLAAMQSRLDALERAAGQAVLDRRGREAA
jgi:hypothetical protein